MKIIQLSSLLMLFIGSAEASISSTCKIAAWKTKDAICKPSEAIVQERVASIIKNAQQEHTRLCQLFFKDNTEMMKEISDLVKLYNNARYPSIACVNDMFRAQKACDTQIQLLEYAESCYNKFQEYIFKNKQSLLTIKKSFLTLRTNLEMACETICTTTQFNVEIAASEQAERYEREDDNFFHRTHSSMNAPFMKSPSSSEVQSSLDHASIECTNEKINNVSTKDEYHSNHGVHPDNIHVVTPW